MLDAARRGAAAFVAKPTIITLHAVTAPMAFLLLAPHLEPPTCGAAVAAFARSHRRHGAPAAIQAAAVVPEQAALTALADRWDAHPAKLVEATLRAHRLTGEAVFLQAASTMLSE